MNNKNEFLEYIKKDKNNYNGYMGYLFAQLSFFSVNPNNPQDANGKLLKNFENNIKKLVQHIDDIKDNPDYHDMYLCLSCIFGAFLGDAIGAYCEFKSASKENIYFIFYGNPMFGDSPGQVTDDSEMAMCSAFGIMDNPNMLRLNKDYLYYYYGCWYLSNPRDIGFTTRSALQTFDTKDFDPDSNDNFKEIFSYIRESNYNSLANGFLMRTSPIIVWCYYRFKKLIENTFKNPEKEKLFELFEIIRIQVKKDDICTHPNDSICIAHSCFCIMSLAAICGYHADQILDFEEKLLANEYFNSKRAVDIKTMIMDEINQHKKDKEENKDKEISDIQEEKGFEYFTKIKNVYNKMGFYIHAFRLTLYYLSYFDFIKEDKYFTKYRKIMNQICTYGGDTDTNAAIVGAVIGPLIGYKNFGDEEFRQMVELVPNRRYIFSPALMVLYVYFLKKTNNIGEINSKMNFLRMILNVSYEEIDFGELQAINSENKENNNNSKEELQKEEDKEEIITEESKEKKKDNKINNKNEEKKDDNKMEDNKEVGHINQKKEEQNENKKEEPNDGKKVEKKEYKKEEPIVGKKEEKIAYEDNKKEKQNDDKNEDDKVVKNGVQKDSKTEEKKDNKNKGKTDDKNKEMIADSKEMSIDGKEQKFKNGKKDEEKEEKKEEIK